ncbi:hypothetical protein K491DRAFT_692153 [Lophiostoma macrostomum CBS 122681]|uniref:Uncharacterized protein n=1 Tax=Lophiostoma macrostomum CBS 122681 TaxID=1314788 RepID=A0A6A6T8P6_9PLEO|nr:hypothetical protein K491DRAFT_692153 [Lophiostoma macrostomum CBS 122681]
MIEVLPIDKPQTAEWGRKITHSDYQKMLKGSMPEDMDDKWMVITDKPDAQGNTVVHLCRSWTNKEVYSYTVEAGDPNSTEAKDWATIVKVSWPEIWAGEEVTEEEAKESAIAFSRGRLGCDMKD